MKLHVNVSFHFVSPSAKLKIPIYLLWQWRMNNPSKAVTDRWWQLRRRIFRNYFVCGPAQIKSIVSICRTSDEFAVAIETLFTSDCVRWYKYNIYRYACTEIREQEATSTYMCVCVCVCVRMYFSAVYREKKSWNERARELGRTRSTVCRGNCYSFGDERARKWNRNGTLR